MMLADQRPPAPPRRSLLAQRLWLVPAVTLLALVGGFVYLAKATPIYRAAAVLSYQDGSSARVAAEQLQADRGDLLVQAIPDSSNVVVGFAGPDAQETVRHVNAAVDRYLNQSNSTTAPSANSHAFETAELKRQRDKLSAERAKAQAAIAQFQSEHPELAASESSKADDERIAELTRAFTTAQLQAIDAKAQLDATTPMLTDPRKAQDLINLNRGKGFFESLDHDRVQIEKELIESRQTLDQQKQTLGAQNPARVATERTIAELLTRLQEQQQRCVEVYRTFLEQQWQTALHKQDQLARIIAAQKTKPATNPTTAATTLSELQTAAAALSKSLDEIESKLKTARFASPSIVTPNVRLEQPAQVPTKPSWPDKTRVMATSLTGGVLLGVIAAALAALLGRS